ncbi:hypothetical protein SLS55_005932 [Diplodia seriata]|uniref:C2H2-type domain-containing protein n=1 Tax=Diplodia seriata TaxID=420778 RepID=A0ABR3CHT4_9PEZI
MPLPSPPQNTCHTAPAEDDAYIPEPAAGEKRSTSDPLKAFGIPLYDASVAAPKAWRCGFPGCASQVLFTRGCDLHKHYRRHSQRFYCRVDGCPRSSAAAGSSAAALDRGGGGGDGGGPTRRRWWFASKKDRDRHEAKHSPRIRCSWQGAGGDRCERVFSRLDNMKDHVRRVHRQR